MSVETQRRERLRRYARKYYEANKQRILVASRVRHHKYYEANKDKIKAKYRKYRSEHREYFRQKMKEQYSSHPHRIWASVTLSAHRRRGRIVKVSLDELEAIAKDARLCHYCGTPLSWGYYGKLGKPQDNSPSLDLINRDASIECSNIRIVCQKCNMAKGEGTLAKLCDYARRLLKQQRIQTGV